MRHQAYRPAIDVGSIGEGAIGRLRGRLAELLGLLKTDTAVLLRRTASGDFQVVAAAGTAPLPSEGDVVPGGENSVCGYAAVQQGAVVFENVPATSRFSGATMATKFGAVSSAAVALRHLDTVPGVLSVHSRTARSFTAADVSDVEAASEGLVLSLALLDAGAGADHAFAARRA